MKKVNNSELKLNYLTNTGVKRKNFDILEMVANHLF